jgi:hypothetical protein
MYGSQLAGKAIRNYELRIMYGSPLARAGFVETFGNPVGAL